MEFGVGNGQKYAIAYWFSRSIGPFARLHDLKWSDRHDTPLLHGQHFIQAEFSSVGYPTLDHSGALRTASLRLRAMTIRILIANDRAVARKELTTLLETHAGWKVCGEAENGQEAVVKAAQLRPDLIILDLSMPIMDGLRAARRIAKIMPRVPILVYTEHHYWEIELEGEELGVRRLVPKTDDAGELFSLIETIVSSEP